MSTPVESLGMIAGNRSLPLLFAEEARRMGVKRLVAVAFENETDPKLASLVDEIVWLRVGQLSKMIKAFNERGVTRCVMAGQIAPKNLFDLRPDLRAMLLLFKLKEKNAHSIFGGIAQELGIRWSFGIGLPLIVLGFALAGAFGSRPVPHESPAE